MNFIKIGIITGGILLLLLALAHSLFYRLFKWERDFENITSLNRKIIYTIHVALTLSFLPSATISLLFAEELSQGQGLAAGITTLYSLFWLWRLVWQVIYFKHSDVKNNIKLQLLNYLLILIFFILFVTYLSPIVYRYF